jgi:hypothetical protein
MDFVAEFWLYLKERKKFWLLPLLVVLLLSAGLLVLAKGSVLAPFIYSVF